MRFHVSRHRCRAYPIARLVTLPTNFCAVRSAPETAADAPDSRLDAVGLTRPRRSGDGMLSSGGRVRPSEARLRSGCRPQADHRRRRSRCKGPLFRAARSGSSAPRPPAPRSGCGPPPPSRPRPRVWSARRRLPRRAMSRRGPAEPPSRVPKGVPPRHRPSSAAVPDAIRSWSELRARLPGENEVGDPQAVHVGPLEDEVEPHVPDPGGIDPCYGEVEIDGLPCIPKGELPHQPLSVRTVLNVQPPQDFGWPLNLYAGLQPDHVPLAKRRCDGPGDIEDQTEVGAAEPEDIDREAIVGLRGTGDISRLPDEHFSPGPIVEHRNVIGKARFRVFRRHASGQQKPGPGIGTPPPVGVGRKNGRSGPRLPCCPKRAIEALCQRERPRMLIPRQAIPTGTIRDLAPPPEQTLLHPDREAISCTIRHRSGPPSDDPRPRCMTANPFIPTNERFPTSPCQPLHGSGESLPRKTSADLRNR